MQQIQVANLLVLMLMLPLCVVPLQLGKHYPA